MNTIACRQRGLIIRAAASLALLIGALRLPPDALGALRMSVPFGWFCLFGLPDLIAHWQPGTAPVDVAVNACRTGARDGITQSMRHLETALLAVETQLAQRKPEGSATH